MKRINNIPTFVINIIRTIPLQAIFLTAYTVSISLLPAFRTLATAGFIDTATTIFAGENSVSYIYLPIFLIGISIIYENTVPVLKRLADTSSRNMLRLTWRAEMLEKKACLEYRYLEDKESCDLIDRVCSNIEDKIQHYFQSILNGIGLLISISSLLAIIFQSTLPGGLAISLISVSVILLSSRLGRKNYELGKTSEAIKRRYTYLSSILMDREYAQERKLFDYSNFIKKKYDSLFEQSYHTEAGIQRKKYRNMKSGSIITILIGMVIMIILLPTLRNGRISSGTYIALISTIFSLVQSMSWQLSSVMYDMAHLKEFIKDMNSFLAMEEKAEALSSPEPDRAFHFQTIEFKNVCFRYPGTHKYILKNCSFLLSADKAYALVGENGSGKSTIIKLLTGLYSEYEGTIKINGKSIKEYSYAELKSLISVAFQDYSKYDLSLWKNIQLGNLKQYDIKRIQKVLDDVGLLSFCNNLKHGLYTELGILEQENIDLSEGQWQRIEIARLLYANREINILDEPTAALDPVAEAQIYELFRQIRKNRFVIYITHRLGSAKTADEILVLKDGHIAEQGSHEELMSHPKGLYQTMYNIQKQLNQRNGEQVAT